jgi:hypothetical protein
MDDGQAFRRDALGRMIDVEQQIDVAALADDVLPARRFDVRRQRRAAAVALRAPAANTLDATNPRLVMRAIFLPRVSGGDLRSWCRSPTQHDGLP